MHEHEQLVVHQLDWHIFTSILHDQKLWLRAFFICARRQHTNVTATLFSLGPDEPLREEMDNRDRTGNETQGQYSSRSLSLHHPAQLQVADLNHGRWMINRLAARDGLGVAGTIFLLRWDL